MVVAKFQQRIDLMSITLPQVFGVNKCTDRAHLSASLCPALGDPLRKPPSMYEVLKEALKAAAKRSVASMMTYDERDGFKLDEIPAEKFYVWAAKDAKRDIFIIDELTDYPKGMWQDLPTRQALWNWYGVAKPEQTKSVEVPWYERSHTPRGKPTVHEAPAHGLRPNQEPALSTVAWRDRG